MCFEAIGAKGGKYVGLEAPPTQVKYIRRDITVDWVQALSLFGKPVKLEGVYGRPASPLDRQFAAYFYQEAEKWTEQGLIRGPDFQLGQDGLEGIRDGIDHVRKGQVQGYKLVYPIA
jgi:aspyridone synthetase trans-acting enoyl reductase